MPEVQSDSQLETPVSTLGYGAREHVDDTRQAQHQLTNDTPVDVNYNAIMARSQALTIDAMGKMFAENSDRRAKIFDYYLPPRPGTAT